MIVSIYSTHIFSTASCGDVDHCCRFSSYYYDDGIDIRRETQNYQYRRRTSFPLVSRI